MLFFMVIMFSSSKLTSSQSWKQISMCVVPSNLCWIAAPKPRAISLWED